MYYWIVFVLCSGCWNGCSADSERQRELTQPAITSQTDGDNQQNLTEAAQDSDDEATIIKALLQTQTNRWNQGDIDGFMETYWRSDKLTFSSGGKTTRGWQATLNRYKVNYDSRDKMGTLDFSDLEISPLGPEVALVLGSWRLTFAEDSTTRPMVGKFTLVLQKFTEGWRIIHDHTSTLNE